MGHVRVFAQPVGGLHDVPALAVTHHARRLPELRFRVLTLFGVQPVAVLVVGLFLVVHEEVDAGGEEVHRRGLEELVAAAASLFLALLQRFQQGLRRLAGRSEVVDVLRLDGVHPPAVLHIDKIDDVELAPLRQLSQLLVLPVMVIQLGGQSGEFVVVNDQGEAFCGVLADERLDDGEGLSASRSADHPRSPERVADVHPALAELALVIVAHGDVHAVFIFHQFRTLLETLVLKVEAVFQQTFLQEFRDVVQGDMHEYHAGEGGGHVEDDVHGQRVQLHSHRTVEQPYGEDKQRKARRQGQDDLPPGVELQMFLVPRAQAGDADQQDGRQLAVHKVPVAVYRPTLDASVNVGEDAAPVPEKGGVKGVLEKLQQHRHIDHRAEYPVKSL